MWRLSSNFLSSALGFLLTFPSGWWDPVFGRQEHPQPSLNHKATLIQQI